MNYKEFYIWMEGYLHGKLENKHIDIAPIVVKMGEVKDEPSIDIPRTSPRPANPFPKRDDPYSPPFEVYCGTKKPNK
jgi:hypothetical protein